MNIYYVSPSTYCERAGVEVHGQHGQVVSAPAAASGVQGSARRFFENDFEVMGVSDLEMGENSGQALRQATKTY